MENYVQDVVEVVFSSLFYGKKTQELCVTTQLLRQKWGERYRAARRAMIAA